MASGKITKRSVDAISKGTADVFLWDDELKGFGLKVTPKDARTYIYQYRLGGRGTKTKRWTIGGHGNPWTAVTARTEAERLARLVGQGIDPVEEGRKRAERAVTLEFGAYLDNFVKLYLTPEWGSSWKLAKRRLEMHVLPKLKGRVLSDLSKADINGIFDPLKDRPALARNTWAVLGKMFAWAEKRGDLAINIMLSMDPPPVVKARKRVLTDDEILALWRASQKLNDPFGRFVRLLLLTLQRRNEVAGTWWKELSHNEGLWRLPGERAKNGLDHLVPVSSLARYEFGKTWKHRGLVFTTTGETPISGFSKLKARLDTLMLAELVKIETDRAKAAREKPHPVELEPWRIHDLRRTGTTKMQRLGFPIEVTERVINHHQGGEASGIRGIYNLYEYQDEKTRALQAWSDWIDQLVKGLKRTSNVVPIAAAAAS